MSGTSIGSDSETTIRTFYESADSGDVERALAQFTEDAEIRFGNDESGVGEAALLEVGGRLQTVTSSVTHDITDVFVNSDQTRGTAELGMTYVRHDGSELRLPAAGVFAFDDEHKITAYHVYVDWHELFSDAEPTS